MSRLVARQHPDLVDAEAEIRAGRVLVDGWPNRNPDSMVDVRARLTIERRRPLRGEPKLEAALSAFRVPIAGRVALDVGAAAGGFTKVLLEAGARRVYCVDAGFGQLAGSLRQDARVVNLERTNLGDLDRRVVPEPIDVITIDVSYVALAIAIPQLEKVEIAASADLIALVKPMFELGLSAPPSEDRLDEAVGRATRGIEASGWNVVRSIRSPVAGSRGAIEVLVHATRRGV